jgi:hypothetical protein
MAHRIPSVPLTSSVIWYANASDTSATLPRFASPGSSRRNPFPRKVLAGEVPALPCTCSSPKCHPVAKMGLVHRLGGGLGNSFRLGIGSSVTADENEMTAKSGVSGSRAHLSRRSSSVLTRDVGSSSSGSMVLSPGAAVVRTRAQSLGQLMIPVSVPAARRNSRRFRCSIIPFNPNNSL